MTYSAIPAVLYQQSYQANWELVTMWTVNVTNNALKYMKDHIYLNLLFMSLPLSVQLASFAASCKL